MTTAPAVTDDVRRTAREDAERHLRALVGRDDAVLREDQWDAIEALAVDRRRALVVQRTGWGKSAVYFVATKLLRQGGAGPTVIVSPLLALMRNQIAAAERAGIRAVTINSTNIDQWQPINDQINAGDVDVLLVSPERLNNPGFRDEVLPRLAATCGLLVVDEAHCISDWGHDFRPDYRRLRTLLAELPSGIPVLATTATANARVTDDVAEQLGVHADGVGDSDASVLVQRGTLDRESLRLGVVRLSAPQQRLAWLADHLAEQPGSGIVYCLTVAATQEVAGYLRDRGLEVAAYSGQTEADERHALEQALVEGRVKALVATSALGMGFDASLGFVVNLGAPASPVAYYQQVGRAGRGTDEATVVLLPQVEDRDIWAYFASLGFPREEQVRETLAALAESDRPLSTATIETRVELGRNRLESMLKVLDVDGAVQRVQGGWVATGRPWAYDAERYARVAEAREREQQAMLGYLSTTECRMRYLREQLDDPDAADCGRCDNCGGLSLSTEVSEAAVAEADARLARPGVVVEPRRMWPTALANLGLDLKGKIAAGAEPGRAVARLTDLGHGQALRALFREDTPDGPVPPGLAQAVMDVMKDWSPEWRSRPDAIVVVESATRPTLTRDLADGLARVMQIPVVGTWAIRDGSVPPRAGQSNSAQRVAAVRRRGGLDAQVPPGATVLLVDDQVASGWTLTVAAAAIRDAGAAAVLPLVLATQG
ncbi:ATP-dependent DNA helicase RecQ [Nocardioides sp. zg-1308]|uniref:ATP-dependent DNA helicase RecQ n=1 Tax=Nocardioides renjunii TaxID=3095075 RepID=A0ABU5K9H1_9ACTN|nr:MULTISPECIES: DEAD/DEAH box helicase [unclassified Nocardioides]MDZ5661463.1 DEAD/DEAH box helicase [Nocardioides sp. S-58]NPD04570.1 ATP-dependent DNA helicase RecQ [Nocardioides sp. zg-1308]WQQ22465.1 DEAD/DEAH box helicase [Nocardioides sp. S-34]